MEVLKDRNQYNQAISQGGVAILEGTAKWCQQCKNMEPFVSKMMEKFPKARFYQYDTEEADDLVNELGNHPMPCFTIFREGDKVDTVMGPHNNALENAIQGCYSGEVRE